MTQILCPKEITIYHIPTQKVGSSSNLKKRMSNQGYNLDDCEVLHTVEPDTMTYRNIWELEQQEASERGYFVEHEGNYQQFLRSHTNNIAKDPAVRAKMTGENNPCYGRTGEANPCYGRTGEANPMFGIKPANTKSYNILNLDGSLFDYTDDPAGFEKQHDLSQKALNRCANPNSNQRHITINGIKYTVTYSTEVL